MTGYGINGAYAPTKHITSVKNPLVTETASLKTEGGPDAFLLEGDKFINDMLPRDILRIFSTEPGICASYAEKGVENYEVSGSVLSKLSGETSRSRLVAVVRKHGSPMPERLLLLDGIQDPGNCGTMIRTASAFGFGVICGEGTANPFLPKAVRSAAGAVCGAYIERTDLETRIPELKRLGFLICGSALDENALSACKTAGKTALVIGSEGRGLSAEVAAMCDRTYYIPIKNVESLNAAVAAGILMFALGGDTD